MKTEIYQPTDENLAYCASLIAKGEIVAFPTETVYGLGANALCPESVKKIYAAKVARRITRSSFISPRPNK